VPAEPLRSRIAEALGPVTAPYSEPVGSGATVRGVWLGQPGLVQFEVCELESDSEPLIATLRAAWRKRRAQRARPLIVFWQGPSEVLMTEPTGEPQVTILSVPSAVALTVIQRALQAPRGEAVTVVMSLLERAQGSGGIAGFRNRNLLSTHYVTGGFKRNSPGMWDELAKRGSTLREDQGAKLLRALGYNATSATAFEVIENGKPRVHAIALPPGTPLDKSAAGPGGSPTTRLLVEANAKGAERAVIISGRLLRIYIADPAKGLDDVATASNYIELDLDLLDAEAIGLLPMLFDAAAHAVGGLFDQLVEQSTRYAVALRGRFRERVYENVVGDLAKALYDARGRRNLDAGLLYQATLRLLYRLLFVLYAEDRNLLPLGNSEYRRISLTQMLFRLDERNRTGLPFDARQTTYWDDMFRVFSAIREGNVELNVPAYNGGLFEPILAAHPEAAFLHSVSIPNAVLAPILLALGFDEQDGHPGKVDFGDLGVRHLGTLYEGLLSFSVQVAETNLVVDRDGLYVPAKAKDEPLVTVGEVYVTSPKGGRKASGSHYTPTFVVRRLLENALQPVLERHLEDVAKKAPSEQWDAMLSFHVVDPAMGSGHFLVDALDVIANRFAKFLADSPRISAAPIKTAREQINAIGKEYGIESLGETIGDFELLRRIVMRNCVYGVDLNRMAVELAKLSLWLHAFVPGLPLSFLGHNLRFGNALVGVVGPEIADKLGKNLFGGPVSRALDEALQHAKKLASLSDLSTAEVKESERTQEALERSTTGITNAFDAFSCRVFARNDDLESRAKREMGRASLESADGLLLVLENKATGEQKRQIARAQAVARALDAFHWQLAFPEVFVRDRPGFDVILGNPPWEEITVERLGFFTLYIPGLKSFASQAEQERLIKSYERRHPDVEQAYLVELESKEELREIVRSNYVLARSGDPDLYRAFAELALNVVREQGAIGMVYPRTLLGADGTAPYRARLFSEMSVTADFALNSGGWVFEDAEPRYTVVALAGIRDAGRVLDTAGPAVSEVAWERLPVQRVRWTYEELEKASPGLEVPLSSDRESAELFHKVVVAGQPFEVPVNGVQFRPWTPIHATNDRKSGALKERTPKSRGWPVLGGRNFYLWEPDIGESEFVLDEKLGIDMLQRKRQRSDVWSGFDPKVLADPKTLPQFSAHVVFRDVARRNDSRTVITALLPPKRFTINNAPVLVQRGGTALDLALRLGVMCSLPFDWIARRRVESHVNFFILNALPVPRVGLDSALGLRTARLAARLATPDDRFAGFAQACGVAIGSRADNEKDDLIAELDAVVAAMYGLTGAELDLIFRDFTFDAVPEPRRAAIRQNFARIATEATV